MTQHPVAAICRTLRMARQTAYYAARVRPAGCYRRLDDETVLQQIRAVTNSRATYGYRRVWAMVNRTFRAGYNRIGNIDFVPREIKVTAGFRF